MSLLKSESVIENTVISTISAIIGSAATTGFLQIGIAKEELQLMFNVLMEKTLLVKHKIVMCGLGANSIRLTNDVILREIWQRSGCLSNTSYQTEHQLTRDDLEELKKIVVSLTDYIVIKKQDFIDLLASISSKALNASIAGQCVSASSNVIGQVVKPDVLESALKTGNWFDRTFGIKHHRPHPTEKDVYIESIVSPIISAAATIVTLKTLYGKVKRSIINTFNKNERFHILFKFNKLGEAKTIHENIQANFIKLSTLEKYNITLNRRVPSPKREILIIQNVEDIVKCKHELDDQLEEFSRCLDTKTITPALAKEFQEVFGIEILQPPEETFLERVDRQTQKFVLGPKGGKKVKKNTHKKNKNKSYRRKRR
jgi:hypothetical protein